MGHAGSPDRPRRSRRRRRDAGTGDQVVASGHADACLQVAGALVYVVSHLANPNCLTVYDGALYWPNADDGTIMTSALDGTGASVLAKGQDLTAPPTTVAVDDRFVYWQSAASVTRLAR